jgi:acyl-ACP thioesterase
MTAEVAHFAPAGPGRVFSARRTVRVGDVLPSGEARLDALARYLQDAAADDGADAAVDGHLTWVVRRTILAVARRPVVGERLEIDTWASAAGSRWAERRTTVRCPAGFGGRAVVEATALWVCLDASTRRPARLSPRFWHVYGEAVGGRTVSPRLTHHEPPVGVADDGRPWPLRVADIDVLEHLNNAATWTAVEDELQRVAPRRPIVSAELEHRSATGLDADLWLCSQLDDREARVWLIAEGEVQASAVTRFGGSSGGLPPT